MPVDHQGPGPFAAVCAAASKPRTRVRAKWGEDGEWCWEDGKDFLAKVDMAQKAEQPVELMVDQVGRQLKYEAKPGRFERALRWLGVSDGVLDLVDRLGLTPREVVWGDEDEADEGFDEGSAVLPRVDGDNSAIQRMPLISMEGRTTEAAAIVAGEQWLAVMRDRGGSEIDLRWGVGVRWQPVDEDWVRVVNVRETGDGGYYVHRMRDTMKVAGLDLDPPLLGIGGMWQGVGVDFTDFTDIDNARTQPEEAPMDERADQLQRERVEEEEARDRASEHSRCDKARPGWRCTRQAGHEGPCAAVEDAAVEQAKAVAAAGETDDEGPEAVRRAVEATRKRMQRVRIVGDGSVGGTRVYDEGGRELKTVTSVEFGHQVGEVPQAYVKTLTPSIDVAIDADVDGQVTELHLVVEDTELAMMSHAASRVWVEDQDGRRISVGEWHDKPAPDRADRQRHLVIQTMTPREIDPAELTKARAEALASNSQAADAMVERNAIRERLQRIVKAARAAVLGPPKSTAQLHRILRQVAEEAEGKTEPVSQYRSPAFHDAEEVERLRVELAKTQAQAEQMAKLACKHVEEAVDRADVAESRVVALEEEAAKLIEALTGDGQMPWWLTASAAFNELHRLAIDKDGV